MEEKKKKKERELWMLQFDLADSRQSQFVPILYSICEPKTEQLFSFPSQSSEIFQVASGQKKHMTTPSPLKMSIISAKPKKSMTKTFCLNDSSATVSVKASQICFYQYLAEERTR